MIDQSSMTKGIMILVTSHETRGMKCSHIAAKIKDKNRNSETKCDHHES